MKARHEARARLVSLAGVVLLLAAAPSFGEERRPPKAPPRTETPPRRTGYRLDEIRISGRPETSGIRYRLPREAFRLLPLEEVRIPGRVDDTGSP